MKKLSSSMYTPSRTAWSLMGSTQHAQNSATDYKSTYSEPESSILDAVNGCPLSILLTTGLWPGHLHPITAIVEEGSEERAQCEPQCNCNGGF